MRYAILDGNAVVNVVLWDGETPLEGSEHFVPVGPEVGPGWTRDGDQWVPPPSEPEPAPPFKQLRRQAYQREADPLFFKWQRGEAAEQDWLDAIQSIKDRYPEEETPWT